MRPPGEKIYLRILLLSRRQSFKERIHLSGNQTETSKNKGKSIQDPHSANTEAVSICSLLPPPLPPKRNIAYKESPISFAPFRSVKTSSPTIPCRNTNYRLMHVNTLERNRFPSSIKCRLEVTLTRPPPPLVET